MIPDPKTHRVTTMMNKDVGNLLLYVFFVER